MINTSIPEIKNPLKHSGTHQFERLAEEMSFSYVQIEERHEADFLLYAEKLAGAVQFYDASNLPAGDWQSFFNVSVDSQQPYRALFIAFVRLLEALNEHANGLSERHLNYYYREVLQFVNQTVQPEKAHVFFECAETLKERFIEKGSALIAGKNKDGEPILFETVEELVVNQGKLKQVLTLFKHPENYGNRLFSKEQTNELLGDHLKNSQGVPTFGTSQTVFEKQSNGSFKEVFGDVSTMNYANVGFAISSSVLRMTEGIRKIFLTLDIELSKTVSFVKEDFIVELTTEDGWLNIVPTTFSLTSTEINIEIRLEETASAITNYDKEIHNGTYRNGAPVLGIRLAKNSDVLSSWKHINLKNVHLSVDVQGVQSLILQNELTTLDPSKPFRPFGPIPAVGNRFYVGHEDIFAHKLDSVDTNWIWKGVPEASFESYYDGYEANISNDEFKVQSELLKDRNWSNLSHHQLFDTNDARASVMLTPNVSQNNRITKSISLDHWDYQTNHGFLRFTLTGPDFHNFQAFGHTVYASEVIQSNQTNPGAVPPNQPYVPMLERLTLDYTTTKITFFDPSEYFEGEQTDFFYHIEPFGEKEVLIDRAQKSIGLLPEFTFEGELIIGMEALELPQSVSLLFQFVEGTGEQKLSRPKTNVQWFYLSNNEWKPLDRLRISQDTTRNMLHTGIMRFDLPEEMNDRHTVLPDNTFWIKAGIPENAGGIDRLQSVRIQAVEVIEKSPEQRELSLAPSAISKLSKGNKGIVDIQQPFGSFEGSSVETSDTFYARVTERLRHKDRGVMIWDYERLILDSFPELFKVKCLNHTNYQTELAPGHVMVAVIPNLRRKESTADFQPKLSIHRRMDIYDFLRERISPFIYLRVENPIYEPIHLTFNVGFHQGFDEGFYGKKLHTELQKFLAPWAFEQELNANSDLVFGGELHKSVVLKFIEDQQYVDFVNDFNMYHRYQDPRVADYFDTELNGQDPDFGHASHRTEGVNNACDAIKLAFQVEDENELTSLMEIKVRFLKGIMELNDSELVERFIKDLNRSLEKRVKKGQPITRTALRIITKNMFYVDQVIDISLYRMLPDGYVMEDVDVAEAKTSRSIMVTAEQHRIGVYQAGDYNCEGNLVIGIGFMIVEADFIIPEINEENYEYKAR